MPLRSLYINLLVLFDLGANAGRGLSSRQTARFRFLQDQAARHYAVSGIRFQVQSRNDAYLRMQGYSVIPEKFLNANMLNLFVTPHLGYDLDKDRTGGCSMGARPPNRRSGGNPFYQTFLGIDDAHDHTLEHEYAHQFTLDTRHGASAAGNFWADIRNDYWLWRQRHGTAVPEFRACAGLPWAHY